MGGFLHFVETGLESLTLDQCAKLGLAHAFTQQPSARKSQLALDGPAVSGLLLYDTRDFDGVDQGVNVARQRWEFRGEFDGQRVWTGVNADAMPTPEDLELGNALAGYPWTDANGTVWRLPRIGDVDDGGNLEAGLPCSLKSRGGKLTKCGVVARYRELWRVSEGLWNRRVGGEVIDGEEAYQFAAQCFGSLYRVGVAELNLLEVFSEEPSCTPAFCLELAIGYFTLKRWEAEKKTDPFSPSSETRDSGTTDGNAG